jgi:dimethylargininase
MKPPSISRRLLASLAAGLVTGVVVYAAVFLAYYVASLAGGGTVADVPGIFQSFGTSGVILVVLLVVAGIFGGLRNWRRALGIGILVGIIAPYLGIVTLLTLEGTEFTLASDNAFLDLISYNLLFFVLVVVGTLFLARRIYAWAFDLRVVAPAEVHRMAIIRHPATSLAKGQITHIKRQRVNLKKADEQWDNYVGVLEAEGFTTLELPQDDNFPDSVFVEDTVVMLGQDAVVASPGAESRRGEEAEMEAAITDLGLATHHIRLPGTLDGGDVLKVGTTVYVGASSRTNGEGIRQFRLIARDLGYTVVAVPVTRALHLKSTVTALPDGTVIGHSSLVDNPSVFERYLEVPEVGGVAVLVLSQSSVLLAASAPKTAALIESLGYRVVTVDISEFEKLEGCVTCLSVRIR